MAMVPRSKGEIMSATLDVNAVDQVRIATALQDSVRTLERIMSNSVSDPTGYWSREIRRVRELREIFHSSQHVRVVYVASEEKATV